MAIQHTQSSKELVEQHDQLASRPFEVLLVEDNLADVDLTKEALSDAKMFINLSVVNDGEQALNYLKQSDHYRNVPRPDLILLDLNLPKKDGREVLLEIKSDQFLRSIPIVILSTSDAELDILKSYNLGANCYITKPVGFNEFARIVNSIGDFWFTIVKLPPGELIKYYRTIIEQGTKTKAQRELESGIIRVLLVEDKVADADIVREYLSSHEKYHFEIQRSGSLSEATNFINREGFHVILLDLNLPDSSGLNTFEKIKAMASSTPVLILTGIDDRELALKVVRGGAQDYLVKGQFDSHMLTRLIEFAIERTNFDRERSELLLSELAAKQRAETALLSRDEFLAIASHELKTPLTSLKLMLELARKRVRNNGTSINTGAELISVIQSAERQINRLSHLIQNTLEISQINAGRLKLELEEFDLVELVTSIAHEMEEQLTLAKCKLEISSPAALIGYWDRFRIEQVVVNLLTNAMKFGSGKPIELFVGEEKSRAVIKIRDHGIGVSKDDQAKIFGRFQRASLATHFGGLGLGLYIARQIANAHQGSINVESDQGRGATFVVSLPRVAQAA